MNFKFEHINTQNSHDIYKQLKYATIAYERNISSSLDFYASLPPHMIKEYREVLADAIFWKTHYILNRHCD